MNGLGLAFLWLACERIVERLVRFLPLLGMGVVRFVLELRLGWEMVLVIWILLARAEALPESEILPVLGDFFLVLERSEPVSSCSEPNCSCPEPDPSGSCGSSTSSD